MITFKQKEFSPKTTKVIFKAKQAGNALVGAIKRTPQKSKTQIAREAIQVRNNLRPEAVKGKVINGVLDASRKIETAIYQPGHAVNKGIELVAKNPVAAVTYVATAPLPVPSAIVSGAVNKAAKKVPFYTRMSEKLGNTWKNSRIASKLDSISGYDVSRYASMIPIIA